MTPQTGYHGSQANTEIMLPSAANTPTVRASTLPEKMPKPAATTINPMMMCIHPQVVASTTPLQLDLLLT